MEKGRNEEWQGTNDGGDVEKTRRILTNR